MILLENRNNISRFEQFSEGIRGDSQRSIGTPFIDLTINFLNIDSPRQNGLQRFPNAKSF